LFPFAQLRVYHHRRHIKMQGYARNIYILRDREYLSGCFLACDISALEDVEYFDTGTFLFLEELALSEKLKVRGY
jgi:GT2 family glycosyltransferase